VTLRLDNPTAGSTTLGVSLVLNRDGVVICPEIPIGIGVPSLEWTLHDVVSGKVFGFASACKAIGSLAQSPYSEVLKLRVVPRALRVPTVFSFEGGRGALEVDTCQGALPAPTAVEVAASLNLAELDSAAPLVFPVVCVTEASQRCVLEGLEERGVYHARCRVVFDQGPGAVGYFPWLPVMMTNTVQPAAAAVARLEVDEASSTYLATLSLDVRCIAGSHAAQSVEVNVGGEVATMGVRVGSPSPSVVIRLSPGSQCAIKYRSVVPGADSAQPWSLPLQLLLPSTPLPASYRGFERGVAVLSLSVPRSSPPVQLRVRALHGGEPQISEHPVARPSGDIAVGVAVDPYGTCVACVRGVVATASGPCLTPWSSEISFQPLPTIARVRYTGGGNFVVLFRERVCGPAVVHSGRGQQFRVEDDEAPRRGAIHRAATVQHVGADNQLIIRTDASDGVFSVGAVDDSCGRSPTVEAKRHSGRWVRAASMACLGRACRQGFA
jgi:hypothetical protein